MIDGPARVLPRKCGVILTADVGRHPAVRAWTAATSLATEPGCIHVLLDNVRKGIYRLLGVGRGGTAVFAKRARAQKSVIERTAYEQILPRVPLAAPRYYGSHVEEPYGWIFIEDVGDERYRTLDPQHLELGARWIAALHVGAARIAAARTLPSCGPERYLTHLRSARAKILRHVRSGEARPAGAETLDAILSHCDAIEARWERVEEACAGAPETVVHGDFRPKNVRVRANGGSLDVLPIDWATAGWGTPAPYLVRIDVRAYWSVVRDAWPEVAFDVIERLTTRWGGGT